MSKLILLSLNMVSTIFVLGILKGVKEALLITELGVEVISTIKVYGVLPFAVLFTLFYTWLSNLFNQATIYNLLNWFFISYFIVFSFFLYPNNKLINLDFSKVISMYPFLRYHLLMISKWGYTLFFILSELWGSIMLALMFWQLANSTFTVAEAKDRYPILTLVGEIGTLLSGIVLSYIAYDKSKGFVQILQFLCIPIVIAGFIISINIFILKKTCNTSNMIKSDAKIKFNIFNSLKVILFSRYITLITVIVVCYGFCITFIESLWQKYVSLLYTNSLEYCNFIGKVQICLSCATILSTFCSYIVMKKLAWKVGALVTPVIMLVAGSIFFLLIIFQDYLSQVTGEASILSFCLLFGTALNIIIKASKYSFFEPTKEMLYIPLTSELKSKGKSVAEVLGERAGKALAAFTQTTILSIIIGSTLVSIAPFIFFLFLVSVISWLVAINSLSKMFKA